ncbi:SHOCT domain-containing protein [bacterium]|nr:SHOCT domain-containing protein [bacterium]
MLKSLTCPNCSAAYDPASYKCDYCGSFIVSTDQKQFNVPQNVVSEMAAKRNTAACPGIYVFGSLLGQGEIPLRMGAANYYKNALVGVGGKLLLTEFNLYFSSHTFMQGKTDLCIPLKEITEVNLELNLVVSQHVSVTAGGKKHRFVVFGGQEWIDKIEQARRGGITAAMPQPNAAFPQAQAAPAGDYTDELVRLKKLCDAGVITPEEFALKKRQLLGL